MLDAGRRDGSVQGERRAGAQAHGVRVFAGVRWDPFILDAPAALKTIATRKAGVHRPGLDLSRRQERAQPGGRGRLRTSCSTAASCSAWSARR